MATLQLDSAAIDSFTRSPSGPVQSHIRGLADRTRAAAAFRVPQSIREGRQGPHLGDTIEVTSDGDGYLIGSTLPHARVHHEGAQPHPIYPRGGALVFTWARKGFRVVVPRGGGFRTGFRGGVLWIGKGRVDHSGHAGNPYLMSALTETVQGG